MAVHFEAKRAGMAPMEEADIPPWREVLADAHLLIPVGILTWLMMARWSANYAAFCATLSMVAVSWLRPRTAMGPRAVLDALYQAGQTMAPLAVSIAGAGIVISALTATGLVVAFGGIIKDLAGGSLPLLLILVATTVLVLGLGIPTTPAYIIAAAIGVPQILEVGSVALGVTQRELLLPAHMFIFYFAVLADVTPPVAAAAFAAAAIAKASPTITSLEASRFGIAGFTVGFAMIYDPGIMLRGSVLDILVVSAIQAAGLTLIIAAYSGFLLRPMGAALRLLAAGAGLLAAFGFPFADPLRLAVGLGALGLVGGAQLMQARIPARG
jgi:TRAP-type uncharacterized transport system fused permease subunit